MKTVLTSLFLLLSVALYADQKLDSMTVELSAINVIGLPLADSTVNLNTVLTARKSGQCIISINHPGSVAPVGNPANQTITYDTLSVDKDSMYVLSYPMLVTGKGWSWISISAELVGIPVENGNYTFRSVGIEHWTNFSRVVPDNSDMTDTAVYTVQNLQQNPQTTLSITGRVLYDDNFQNVVGGVVGVYGVYVYLYFSKSLSDGDKNLFHPVGGKMIHVHYDKCDINGNFSFQFSGPTDWSEYKYVRIYVSRFNDAAQLDMRERLVVTLPNGEVDDVHFSIYTRRLAVADPHTINYSNQDILITEADGGILRNMLLSNEYVQAYYSFTGMTMPFQLEQVLVYKADPTAEFAGQFNPFDDYFKIRQDHYHLYVCGHEYGHYVHHLAWGTEFPFYANGPNALDDGWATFHGFAVMNWASQVYDEFPNNSGWGRSNLELSPFSARKYDGVSYAYPEDPDDADIGVARFAAYLWGLYDGTSGYNEFYARRFNNLANDDIRGGAFYLGNGTFIHSFPRRVVEMFNAYADEEVWHPYVFHEWFKANLPSDLQASIEDLWDFAQSETTTPRMRSAQITSASTNWVPADGNSANFTWADGSYALGTSFRNFGLNAADGYNVYRSINSSWELMNSSVINPGTTSFGVSNTTVRHLWKITATNPSGDSYKPFFIDLQSVEAIIDGVDAVPEDVPYTWYANQAHGKSPFTYKWYVRLSSTWNQVSTSSSYTRTSDENFDLKLEVTDAWGETDDHILNVIVTGGQWKRSPGDISFPKISDNSNSLLLSVSPNPTLSSSNVKFELPADGEIEMSVWDMLGRNHLVINGGALKAGTITLPVDVSSLPTGMYLLKVNATFDQDGSMQGAAYLNVIK